MARNSLKSVLRLLETTTKEISIEDAFISDLKRSIELTAEKTNKKPSQTYKPSSLQCIRQMYYQVTGTEPEDGSASYSLIGICNSGTDIHERVQTAIAEMTENGIDCDWVDVGKYVTDKNIDGGLEIKSQIGMETKLYHKALNLSFMCDGIVKYKNKYYLIEIKTETSNKFFNRKGVDPKHYDQGTAYSTVFEINDVIFIYVNRDTLDMKSFLFTPTTEQKKNLLNKIYECEEYVKQAKVPSKPQNIIKSVCTYCNYRKCCERDK